MVVFAYYLLKVTLVSAILYAYYLLGLRNKKFHRYNRFYLLFTVILSLVIPLLKVSFSNYQHKPLNILKLLAAINDTDVYVKTTTIKHSFISDFNQIAIYAFLIASAVMSFILISKALQIFF